MKKTAKQISAQKKFTENVKKVAKMVKSGKAKDTKSAWKQLEK